MKHVLMSVIFLFVNSMSFASSNGEQLENIQKLSAELSALRSTLQETIQDKNARTVKFLLSGVAASVLGLYSAKLHSSGSTGIGDNLIKGLKSFVALGGTLTATAIAGYNGFEVVMDIRAIPELERSISQKVVELESAKSLLLSAE